MTRREFHQKSLSASAAVLSLGSSFIDLEGSLSPEGVRRIPKTDTHMHLFGLDRHNYSWLKNAPAINRSFMPEDFIEATRKSNITKIVFMESGADKGYSLKEVEWVKSLMNRDPRIKGIVAKGNIVSGGKIEPAIEKLAASPAVKGIRGGTTEEVLASDNFVKSMMLLAQHNFSFDLLIRPNLFQTAAQAISKVPNTVFMLDHLGNPDIKGEGFDYWKKGITELAKRPNVNCKISGLLTKAGSGWTEEMLRPYVEHVIHSFGFDRIVYGGDWPVVLLAGTYRSWSRVFERLTRQYEKEELHKLYHQNAGRIYRLT